MLPFLSNVGSFISRHRTKLIVTTAVVTAATAIYWYNSSSIDNDVDSNNSLLEELHAKKHAIKLISESQQSRACNRSRIIWRIRKQYDIALVKLLSTLRLRIIDIIDIQGTVKSIKELRSNANKEAAKSVSFAQEYERLERELWDDIKTASFTIMIVSAYMLSSVCILLKIQLYVLARSLLIQQENSSSTNSSYPPRDIDSQFDSLDNDMFRSLIEGTYKHLYSDGIQLFVAKVRGSVSTHLREWVVKDKLEVHAEELLHVFSSIRSDIETDERNIIDMIFMPIEIISEECSTEYQQSINNNNNSDDEPHTRPVQMLLNQIWDVIDSPEFVEVFIEAVDACFQVLYLDLHQQLFSRPPDDYLSHISGIHTTTPSSYLNNCHSNSNSHSNQSNSHQQSISTQVKNSSSHSETLKSPPLASVLPQLKAVSFKLFPSPSYDSNNNNSNNMNPPSSITGPQLVSPDVKDISSGAYLESFCLSIFDAVTTTTATSSS